MSKTLLLSISALFAAGCFFGGEDDTSTAASQSKTLSPGFYVGDYAWIDSNKHGLESEFVLDTDGSYRLFWILHNDAVYDQWGSWLQRDSTVFLSLVEDAWLDGGVFDGFVPQEDDTNLISNITDTSFTRREWTPLRQKPYWITYHKSTAPRLHEGAYLLEKSYGEDADKVDYKFGISLTQNVFLFRVTTDSIETFQADARFYQIGSFVATVDNRQRTVDDSTKTFKDDWRNVDGAVLKRLKTVSDTAFELWNAYLGPNGEWEPYRAAPKTPPGS
ncbi:MAG: hypothetical protein M3Y08_05505 [Fibrobacterota bacterium]|nr:hypothetical protein [Fibrobacterota bacterium]